MPSRAASSHRPRRHQGTSPRERAIRAATEQLLAEGSLRDLTVAQVLERAHVSRGTFYQYFGSKYDVVAGLLAEVFDQIFRDTRAELEATWPDPGAALRLTLTAAVASWSEHRPVIHAVLEHRHAVPALGAAWARVVEPFRRALAEQVAADPRALPGLPAELVSALLVSTAERILYVGAAGADPALTEPEAQVEAVVTIALAAVYGSARGPGHVPRARGRAARRSPGPPPAGGPTARERPAGKRADIVDATRDLLARRPLDSLSVADVLTSSGVSRASFYFNFASLDDAVAALLRERADEALPAVEARLSDRGRRRRPGLDEQLLIWLGLEGPDRALLSTAIRDWPRRPGLRAEFLAQHARLRAIVGRLVEEERAAGVAPDGPAADVLASACVWTLEGAWVRGDDVAGMDELVARTLAAAVYG